MSDFKAVTDDATGVYGQRLTNLKADTAFRRALGAKDIFNTDEQGLNTIYGLTWNALIQDLATRTGIPIVDNNENVVPSNVLLSSMVATIPERRAILGTILDALGVLAAAEIAIQAEILQEVKAAQDAIAALGSPSVAPVNSGIPSPPSIFASFLSLYEQYREALKKAGKGYSDEFLKVQAAAEPALAHALQLQAALLKAAAESRDPGAVYAIAAVVGTGLDETSLTLLRLYRDELKKVLDSLAIDNDFQTRSAQVMASVTAASAVVPAAAAIGKQAIMGAAPTGVSAPASSSQAQQAIGEFSNRVAQLTSKTTLAQQNPGSVKFAVGAAAQNASPKDNPPSGDVNFLPKHVQWLKHDSAIQSALGRAINDQFRALRATPVPPKGKDATATTVPGPAAMPAAGTAAAVTPAAPQNPPAAVATPCIQPDNVPCPLVNALANAALINASTNASLLGQTLDKQINSQLSSPEVQSLLNDVSSVVKDIFTQAQQHQQRVAQFLADILMIGADLHGENKRHYDALATILGRELERWELVADSAETLKANFSAKLLMPV